VAFNGQGQWRQKSWEAFLEWVGTQESSVNKRIHLLRYKSAITRRRLTNLLSKVPPAFTKKAQEHSFAFGGDDTLPAFQKEWTLKDTPLAGPTYLAPNQSPKEATGKEVLAVKKLFSREIRGLEYVEHLIQKTRYEIERIEDEIFWLEASKVKIARHLAIVNAQFKNIEFTGSLVREGSLIRLSLYESASDALVQKHKEGQILQESHDKANSVISQTQNIPVPYDTLRPV